jgi:hypothetical protein
MARDTLHGLRSSPRRAAAKPVRPIARDAAERAAAVMSRFSEADPDPKAGFDEAGCL